MQGIKRKVVYVGVFEAIAIVVCSLGFAALSDRGLGHASVLSVATSVVAVLWNFFFTMMFEAWEAHQQVRGRSVARRMAHAAIFEAGLVILLVPLIAWWLEVSLLRALVMDLGLAAFFLAYTFVFNWCFDRMFGLPASAGPAPSRP